MTKEIDIKYNLSWVPQPNTCRTVISNDLPPLNLITTAFALIFKFERKFFSREEVLETNFIRKNTKLYNAALEIK